jgi:hypothetical protein
MSITNLITDNTPKSIIARFHIADEPAFRVIMSGFASSDVPEVGKSATLSAVGLIFLNFWLLWLKALQFTCLPVRPAKTSPQSSTNVQSPKMILQSSGEQPWNSQMTYTKKI